MPPKPGPPKSSSARVSPRPQWVEIEGFKALREPARVELRPLTLIAGANSGGKSSAMQPLLMMKQTLEATYDPGPLLLDGANVQFTQLDQLLSRGRRKDDVSDAVSVTFGPQDMGRLRLRGLPPPGPDAPVRVTFRAAVGAKAKGFALAPALVEQQAGQRWVAVNEKMSAADLAALLAEDNSKFAEWVRAAGDALQVFPERTGGRFLASVVVGPADGVAGDSARGRFYVMSPLDIHAQFLRAMLHLPGLRGHRERRYSAAQVTERQGVIYAPGPFTPYASSVLARWQDEDDTRLQLVHDGLRAMGLTWKVVARRVNASELELKVARLPNPQQGGASDLVDIADVGFGVSQVLPVVVALAAAVPGQLVYIEQPELHLHPRAQRAMGRLLAGAAQRGVCVVAETHSRLLLRAVQTEVARPGALRAEDVGLHWFCRDADTGFSTVKLAELDKRGTFGDWPVDFGEVETEADEEWLDLALAQEAT
jgi:predicted ATPase